MNPAPTVNRKAHPTRCRGGVPPPAAVGVTKMHRLFSSAVITFAPPFEGGIKGGCFRITTRLECCETDKALFSIFVCINTPPYPPLVGEARIDRA